MTVKSSAQRIRAGLTTWLACISSAVIILQAGFSVQHAAAAESTGAKPVWTKIQDLNPNAPAANQPIKRKWAVVIGIDKFSERRLNIEKKQDDAALEFAAYLEDPHGGRFEKNHVKVLTNFEATQRNIAAALGKEWLGRLAGPDDLVVIFIATNSFPTTDGGNYLCTYNCSLDNVMGTCISIKDLMDQLKKNVNCNRMVLVLQSCYSGAAELDSGAKAFVSPHNADLDKLLVGKGFIILSSSRPEQLSWTNIFSSNLVKALKQENGFIHLRDAFNKAKEATEAETSSNPTMAKQTPVMKWQWKGSDLVLGAPAVEDNSELPESVRTYLSAEAHYLAANRLVEQGKTDDAIEEYKKALVGQPDYSDVMADYGSVLAMKGDWKQAAEMYKRALEVKPDDALYHANYARILVKLGQTDEALHELELAYKTNPIDTTIVVALADRYSQAGNTEQAEEVLQKALKVQPRSAKLHDRLGFALSRQGNIDAAIEQARQAVQLDPEMLMARLNLGSLLLANGKPQDAVVEYRSAVQKSPSSADARYMLAGALEESGDKTSARAEYKHFMELANPSDGRTQKVQQHLQELEAPTSR
jgi:tetratricopeptide (TPR) repeat protein